MRVVADTGPILHLHEAGALDLLPRLGSITLSPLILAEVRSLQPALWPGTIPDWVQLQSPSAAGQRRAQAWQQAGLLHPGEAEALAVALEVRPDWFITDDAAARLLAASLGNEVHGSIGILLWAAARRMVDPQTAVAHLAELERSSLWMSPRVRAEARSALARLAR